MFRHLQNAAKTFTIMKIEVFTLECRLSNRECIFFLSEEVKATVTYRGSKWSNPCYSGPEYMFRCGGVVAEDEAY